MKPCIFFDRDGIVNVAPVTRYVEKLSDFHLQEPFFHAVKIANKCGYETAIITNQKGVSTGATPLAELQAMHNLIRQEIKSRGLRMLDIIYCAGTEDTDPRRKPNPGMLYEAAEKHDLDLSRSWMIGDNQSDILTGQRAGCRTIFVGTKKLDLKPDFAIPDIDQLPDILARAIEEVT